MKNKIDIIKIIGIVGTVMGMTAILLSNYANYKTMEKTINEKVNDALGF